MDYYNAFNSISVHLHHIKQVICGSRAKYRDGKKDRAVKVYTINQESVYIIVTNVPAVGGTEELRNICDQYGMIDEFHALDDYPCEEFTEAYLVKYDSLPTARVAKKKLDDKSFLGSTLHVFYAPEFETPTETSIKLQERRKYVAWKIKKSQNHQDEQSAPQLNTGKSTKLSLAEKNLAAQPVTYIWAGKEYTVYPNAPAIEEPILEKSEPKGTSSSLFVPRQLKQKSSDGSSSSSSNFCNNRNIPAANSKLSHVDESSYLSTVSHVRTKISSVSVPNVRVSLKRKRRV